MSYSPALSTSELEAGLLIGNMFVLETDLAWLRGLPASAAQLNLALIYPTLIGWSLLDILGHVHFAVQFQLLHEAFVWLADRSRLPEVRQRFRWTNVVLLHQVRDDDGS